MKKNLMLIIIFAALITPGFTQIKTLQPTIQQPVLTLAKPKIHATGHAQFYGTTPNGYISASLDLSINGKPLTNVKVFINNSQMRHAGNGTYYGAIPSTYVIKLGNELTYSVVFKKFPVIHGSPPPFTGKVEIGTYRVKNIINWVWPKPNQSITLGRFLSYLFKWDFTGTPGKIDFHIKDRATNTKIFSKHTSAEQENVLSRLFKPAKEYSMYLWAVDPIDKFKMSKHCTPGSKIKWFCSVSLVFNTGKGLMIRK